MYAFSPIDFYISILLVVCVKTDPQLEPKTVWKIQFPWGFFSDYFYTNSIEL